MLIHPAFSFRSHHCSDCIGRRPVGGFGGHAPALIRLVIHTPVSAQLQIGTGRLSFEAKFRSQIKAVKGARPE